MAFWHKVLGSLVDKIKMIYNTIFAKSFSRYEQKKLGYGALVGFLMIVLSLCTVFKPYLGPLHDCEYLNFSSAM
jgi:hypothetical protein